MKLIWFLKRVWTYRRILWNDADFDYRYLIDLMSFKLNLIADHLEKHDMFIGADGTARSARVAAMVCDRISADNYDVMGFCKEGDSLEAWQDELITNRNNDKDHFSKYLPNQDLEYLFLLFKKHLRTWWD
jgi:hypothetical protein